MTTTMRSAICAVVTFLCACFGSDSSSGAQSGGHTNWLECKNFADCADYPSAVACSDDGYCVDDAGGRVGATTGTGGAGTEGGTTASGGEGGAKGGAGGAGSGGTAGGGAGSGGTAGGGGQGGTGACPPCAHKGPPCVATDPCQCDYVCPDGGAGTGCDTEGAKCCDPGDGSPSYCSGGLFCCPNGTCGAGCGGSGDIRIPVCPGDQTERCASERCVTGGTCLDCPTGQVCVEVDLSCGPAGGTTAQCIDDPCAGKTLDCSCAQGVCDALDPAPGGWFCAAYTQDHFLVGPTRDPFMSCSGGGVCASPDTRIATPRGKIAIADLREGDLVYSRETDAIVVVPLLAVARTAVTAHHVLRVTLDNGSVLEVSGPHPTADGRRLDELSSGSALDDARVLSVERIAYAHPFTHDILPASHTGAYLANGVWLGSTLRR